MLGFAFVGYTKELMNGHFFPFFYFVTFFVFISYFKLLLQSVLFSSIVEGQVRFCACKTVLGSHPCTWEIVHIKEQTYRLLTIIWYGSRNCTKLVLKLLAAKNNLLLSCVLLLSCRLYYFSLHDDYPPFLQIVKCTVYLRSATIFDKLKWEPV